MLVEDQGIANILWRGRYLILASLAVSVALAIIVTKTSTKAYEAAAIIQVSSVNTPGNGATDPFTLQQASQVLAKTYATLIVDRSFLEKIRPKVADGRLSAATLQERVSAEAIPNTALLQLKVDGPSPGVARRLASEIANAFITSIQKGADLSTTRDRQAIEAQIASLSNQIEAIGTPSSPAKTEQRASLRAARNFLTQQLANLVATGIVRGGSVSLIAPPTGSSSPVRPRPLLNLAAGVLLGLLAGFGLAWVRARLDRRLHSAQEAEKLLNVPTLASIPIRKRFSHDDPVLGESFDVLRANLAFLSLDQKYQMITFSSYNPREGKTSTVEGLAYAAVRGGMSVLVVDGDVRTRTLSTRLNHGDKPGLTNVVAGLAELDQAIVELEPGLSLLPSGPSPPNPPSLLSSGRMRDLVAELKKEHSLIIVDSPPVANLADASILAALCDGVVFVARVGVTNRVDLAAAVATLRHIPTPVIGAVVLEPRTFDETYYPAATSRRREPRTAVSP